MIGAVAVRRQGSAEIRLRKRGNTVSNADVDCRVIEGSHCLADSAQQVGLILILVVMRIEPANTDEEYLPLHLKFRATGDQLRDSR